MHRSLFILLTLFSSSFLLAQSEYNNSEDSDPRAQAILETIRTNYETLETLQADFALEIEYPEEDKIVQKGKMWQQGDRYHVDMDEQAVISDGKTVWVHLKSNKEIQITNATSEEEGEMLSPKDMLRMYEKDDHVFILTNEFEENGKVVQQIEFKPMDPDAEYSKLRLTVEKKNKDIVRLKSFGKDGSRFTLKVVKQVVNKPIEETVFALNESDYPDVQFEDLRID